MRTILIHVPKSGCTIELAPRQGCSKGEALLAITDDVELKEPAQRAAATSPSPTFQEYRSDTGFPPRSLTEQTIVQIIEEHGGSVRI